MVGVDPCGRCCSTLGVSDTETNTTILKNTGLAFDAVIQKNL